MFTKICANDSSLLFLVENPPLQFEKLYQSGVTDYIASITSITKASAKENFFHHVFWPHTLNGFISWSHECEDIKHVKWIILVLNHFDIIQSLVIFSLQISWATIKQICLSDSTANILFAKKMNVILKAHSKYPIAPTYQSTNLPLDAPTYWTNYLLSQTAYFLPLGPTIYLPNALNIL